MVKKYLSFGLVTCIFLLGLFLRLYHIQEWMLWIDDVGIESLIAKHAIEYKELVTIAPPSGTPFIYNTPTHSAVVTFLWKFLPSPRLIIYVYCFWGSLSILFAYLTGKYAKNPLCGYIFALFIAASPTLINDSNEILRNSINEPFLLILGFLLSYWTKNKSAYILFAVLQLCFLPLHFYSSFFPISLFLIILTLHLIRKTYKQNTISFIAILIILLNIGIFYFLAYAAHPGSFVTFLHTNISLSRYGNRLLQNVSDTFTMSFPYVPFFLSLGVFIGYIFYTGKQIYANKKIGMLVISCLLYFVSMVGISFISLDLLTYRLIIFIPLLYFIFSYSIATFPRTIRYFSCVLFAFYICFVITNFHKFRQDPPNDFYHQTVVINTILKDVQNSVTNNKQLPSFHLFYMQTTPEFIQSSTTLWYLAEELTQTRLITISKSPPFFQPIVEHPIFDYLLCDATTTSSAQYDVCKNAFITFYGQNMQQDTIKIITLNGETGKTYQIYRWNHNTE